MGTFVHAFGATVDFCVGVLVSERAAARQAEDEQDGEGGGDRPHGEAPYGPPSVAQSPSARAASMVACSRTSGGQPTIASSKPAMSPANSARAASSKPGSLPAIACMKRYVAS